MVTSFRSIYRNGRFENYTIKPPPKLSFFDFFRLLCAFMRKPRGVRPLPQRGQLELDVLPVRRLTAEDIENAPAMSLWKISHSTVLMKLTKGRLFLTDPVFSERASPVQWAGPRRFSRLPIDLEELSRVANGERPINGVFISHDHYDHLDYSSIKILAQITEVFFVPLKLGPTLVSMGVSPHRIRELDWWESLMLYDGELQIICTPAHHYSKRSPFSKQKSLWCSWCIVQNLGPSRNAAVGEARFSLCPDGEEEENHLACRRVPSSESYKIFFSGDSGWHQGFAKIGEVCGPFDVTLVENGQYNYKYWHGHHMLPRETAQAHLDLKGAWLIPIHNCTYDLSLHLWYDPLVQIAALSRKLYIDLCTPVFGECVNLLNITPGERWWESHVTKPLPRDAKLLEAVSTGAE